MSRDMVFEDVPQVSRRVGDTVVANQNNSTILLGRDRVTALDSGYGALGSSGKGRGAGAIHLMVGRKGEDPSPLDDSATLYLSAKSDPDSMAETESIGSSSQAVSSAVMRADCIRIIPRADFKLSVGKAYLLMGSDGKITVEGDVSLGEGASERILRGDSFAKLWASVHTHPTPAGPSGPAIQPIPDSLFSPTNKVK